MNSATHIGSCKSWEVTWHKHEAWIMDVPRRLQTHPKLAIGCWQLDILLERGLVAVMDTQIMGAKRGVEQGLLFKLLR